MFEETVLPHLDAAYNLARWLTRNDQDAQDVVQEAYLRALQSFHTFQAGRPARPWLLRIVRNTCYTLLGAARNEMTLGSEAPEEYASSDPGPEECLLQSADSQIVREALEALPLEYRETIVLRDFEGFSYKEIAELSGVPIGTVMSRLSRGREQLVRVAQARIKGIAR